MSALIPNEEINSWLVVYNFTYPRMAQRFPAEIEIPITYLRDYAAHAILENKITLPHGDFMILGWCMNCDQQYATILLGR